MWWGFKWNNKNRQRGWNDVGYVPVAMIQPWGDDAWTHQGKAPNRTGYNDRTNWTSVAQLSPAKNFTSATHSTVTKRPVTNYGIILCLKTPEKLVSYFLSRTVWSGVFKKLRRQNPREFIRNLGIHISYLIQAISYATDSSLRFKGGFIMIVIHPSQHSIYTELSAGNYYVWTDILI